jgi:hypothetical protein
VDVGCCAGSQRYCCTKVGCIVAKQAGCDVHLRGINIERNMSRSSCLLPTKVPRGDLVCLPLSRLRHMMWPHDYYEHVPSFCKQLSCCLSPGDPS